MDTTDQTPRRLGEEKVSTANSATVGYFFFFLIHSAFKFKGCPEWGPRGAASPGGTRHSFASLRDLGRGIATAGGAARGGCGRTWPAIPGVPGRPRQGRRRQDGDLEPQGARGRRCSHANPPSPGTRRPAPGVPSPPRGPRALRPTAAPPRPGPGKGGAAHRSPGRKLPGAAGRSRPPRASSTRAAILLRSLKLLPPRCR